MPREPMRSRAAHFTECPPKPFESACGAILFALDLGANQVFAAALDKSPAWVSRMKDPRDPMHLRASDVARACQALGTPRPVDQLFEGVRIDGSEWRMQRVPESETSTDIELDSMALAGQAGAYVAALGRALVDGQLSRTERAELRQHLVEVRDQVEALIAGLE